MFEPELVVSEIFHSLQGETTLMGVRFAFIRLTGCNLRCTYCDTSYAFKGGKRLRISEIIDTLGPFDVRDVLITGGEPLLQKNTPLLVEALAKKGHRVSIETHGEAPIGPVVSQARIILDVKTPSSGESRGGFRENLNLLKPTDEVKFVIASESDYAWSKEILRSVKIPTELILFSPALVAKDAPGEFPGVSPRWLAERIIEDRLPVRFQYQLHKILWGADCQGV